MQVKDKHHAPTVLFPGECNPYVWIRGSLESRFGDLDLCGEGESVLPLTRSESQFLGSALCSLAVTPTELHIS
jgi:hypothetical protein